MPPCLGTGDTRKTQIGPCCCLPFPVCYVSAEGKIARGNLLGWYAAYFGTSDVFVASLLGLLLTMAMEIWYRECGPFRPNFAFLPFCAMLGTPYLHGAKDLARKDGRFWYHMTKGRSPYVFVFAPPAWSEIYNIKRSPYLAILHSLVFSANEYLN